MSSSCVPRIVSVSVFWSYQPVVPSTSDDSSAPSESNGAVTNPSARRSADSRSAISRSSSVTSPYHDDAAARNAASFRKRTFTGWRKSSLRVRSTNDTYFAMRGSHFAGGVVAPDAAAAVTVTVVTVTVDDTSATRERHPDDSPRRAAGHRDA